LLRCSLEIITHFFSLNSIKCISNWILTSRTSFDVQASAWWIFKHSSSSSTPCEQFGSRPTTGIPAAFHEFEPVTLNYLFTRAWFKLPCTFLNYIFSPSCERHWSFFLQFSFIAFAIDTIFNCTFTSSMFIYVRITTVLKLHKQIITQILNLYENCFTLIAAVLRDFRGIF